MTTDRHIKSRLIILFAVLLLTAGLTGCASQGTHQVKTAEESALITDILTSEDSATFYVTVKGSQPLSYTALRQDSPLGVQFTFPGAVLDNLQQSYPWVRQSQANAIENNKTIRVVAIRDRFSVCLWI